MTDEFDESDESGVTDESDVTDESVEAAVERFLDRTVSALDSYDQGYADADATLTVVRDHMEDLATAVDEGDREE